MARWTRVPVEKPLFWVGSVKGDLLAFPEVVQNDNRVALSVAHFGGSMQGRSRGKERDRGFLKL